MANGDDQRPTWVLLGIWLHDVTMVAAESASTCRHSGTEQERGPWGAQDAPAWRRCSTARIFLADTQRSNAALDRRISDPELRRKPAQNAYLDIRGMPP
jgi:hypothetical protein